MISKRYHNHTTSVLPTSVFGLMKCRGQSREHLQYCAKSFCKSFLASMKARPLSVPTTNTSASYTAMQATSALDLASSLHWNRSNKMTHSVAGRVYSSRGPLKGLLAESNTELGSRSDIYLEWEKLPRKNYYGNTINIRKPREHIFIDGLTCLSNMSFFCIFIFRSGGKGIQNSYTDS